MDLYHFMLHIQSEEGLGTVDFIEKAPISNGMYYDIKSGKKKDLSPKQLKELKDCFPNINYDLITFNYGVNNNSNNIPDILNFKNNPNYKPLTEDEASFIENKFDNNFEELFKREKFKKEFIFRATEWLENFRMNKI